jgi:hypothetical protein
LKVQVTALSEMRVNYLIGFCFLQGVVH